MKVPNLPKVVERFRNLPLLLSLRARHPTLAKVAVQKKRQDLERGSRRSIETSKRRMKW